MEQRGFLRSLLDISFTSLITTRIVKVLYVLAMIGIGLYAIFIVIAAFSASTAAGVAVLLVGAPLFILFTLIYTRVLLEVFVALFRIMENTNELVARAGGPGAPPSGSSPRAATSPPLA